MICKRSGPGAVFIAVASIVWSCNGTPDTHGIGAEPRVAAKSTRSPLDGNRAISGIKDIIAFGPRHLGTPGIEKTRQYILQTLKSFGLTPKRHDFIAYTPHPTLKQVPMANISVDISGPGKKKLLIGGHFDGKIIEGVKFKGANDGGSSTALLMELARYFSKVTPPCGLKIVFFDGEEAVVKWSDMDSLYGSKNLAAELKSTGEDKSIAAVVIVDMIGDARLRITNEVSSTQWVMGILRETAVRLGYEHLFTGPRAVIADDHTPFQQIGIPGAVLIDLKFGPGYQSNAYWHTEKDDIDKISPASIEAVGHVVIESLKKLIEGP